MSPEEPVDKQSDPGATTQATDPEDDAPLLDVLHDYAQASSAHGIAFATSRDFSIWKRALWWLITMVASGFMVQQIVTLILQYRDYEVITSTQVIAPESMSFPQITVCDINPVETVFLENGGSPSPGDENDLLSISTAASGLFWFTDFNGVEEWSFAENDEVWDLVITNNGLCYSFTTDSKVLEPGQEGGLSFTGSVDQGFYLNTTIGAGLSVYVHQEGTRITDQSPAVFVAPGTLSQIEIELDIFDREKDAPWSVCDPRDAPAYTQNQCHEECLNKFAREQCECRQFGDPDASVPFCEDNLFDDDFYIGNASLICDFDYAAALETCDCARPPCYEELYDTKVSNLDFSVDFKADLGRIFNVSSEDVAANLFVVQINYREIRYELLTESKAMTFTQLLAGIGGMMGLFAGISFITAAEVIVEVFGLRLLPRLWGDRRLHGLGSV